MVNRSSLMNKHSYAGLGYARRYSSPPAWAHGLRGAGSYSPSPGSSQRVMCLSDGGETQESDDDMFFDGPMGGLARGDYLSVMPRTSTSVSSIYSDVDQELVTPGFGSRFPNQ